MRTYAVRQGVIDTHVEDHTQTEVTVVPLVPRPRAQRVHPPIGVGCSAKTATRPWLPLGSCIFVKSSTVRKLSTHFVSVLHRRCRRSTAHVYNTCAYNSVYLRI